MSVLCLFRVFATLFKSYNLLDPDYIRKGVFVTLFSIQLLMRLSK